MTWDECVEALPWLATVRVHEPNAVVERGRLVWLGGEWQGGVWQGGVWHDGVWQGGVWHDGAWLGGVWHDGVWQGGAWLGGVWHDGVWQGGAWRGGVWQGGEDRLLFHAACCGIVFGADGWANAYRTTRADGRGRYTHDWMQPEGEYYEPDVAPAGSGTCERGIHVASAAAAWTYFGVEPTAQMWAVRFRREDLLDCDGQKARIRGGIFTKITRPF